MIIKSTIDPCVVKWQGLSVFVPRVPYSVMLIAAYVIDGMANSLKLISRSALSVFVNWYALIISFPHIWKNTVIHINIHFIRRLRIGRGISRVIGGLGSREKTEVGCHPSEIRFARHFREFHGVKRL